MRLADFIRTDIEEILKQWDDFALTIRIGQAWDKSEARDHAREMLLVIAKDLDCPQTDHEQCDKSKGLEAGQTKETPAESHGLSREQAGFSINDVISEFRALRASVISLWTKANPTIEDGEVEDLIRFNEAIDQAVSESMISYADKKEMQTRLFETILSVSPDQLYILDLNSRFMFVNKATGYLYGMRVDEIVGKTYSDLNFPFAADVQQHLCEVAKTKKIFHGEFAHAFAPGPLRTFEYLLAPVVGENATVESIVVISRDITERKAAEEESWHDANFDLLTGLPNRRLFNNRLEHDVKHAQRTGQPVGLLFIDLDNFKEVNDALGHSAGDALLQQAAARINSCVRSTDTVARLGGDEFTVILTEFNEANQLDVVAKKIVDVLEKPFQIDESIARVSGSVGVTCFPQDADSPENLVRNADHAMYLAKRSGRNQVRFFAPLTNSESIPDLPPPLSASQK